MSCPRPNVKRSNPKLVSELEPKLRDRIWTAQQDCPSPLVLVSGYRDPGRQWDLRHARCPGRECDRRCKGYPVTAVPGASQHEKRRAADMGGAGKAWLITNREKYALGLTVSSEDWHFQAHGIDVRTGKNIGLLVPKVRILAYGTKDGQRPVANNVLTIGSRGPAVALTQDLLNIVNSKYWFTSGAPLPVTRNNPYYGQVTAARVREFQRFVNNVARLGRIPPPLVVDGVAGPATLHHLGLWTKEALK